MNIYLNKKTKIIIFITVIILIIIMVVFYIIKHNQNIQNEEADKNNQNIVDSQLKDKNSEENTYIFVKGDFNTDNDSVLKDSNNDGISDEKAQEMGLDPNSLDTDGDGIFDIDEIEITKTDPLKADTDEDGYDDLDELNAGYNPNGEGRL